MEDFKEEDLPAILQTPGGHRVFMCFYEGATSAWDVAQKLGMDAEWVSEIMDQLKAEGLIEDVGTN